MNQTASAGVLLVLSLIPYAAVSWAYAALVDGGWPDFLSLTVRRTRLAVSLLCALGVTGCGTFTLGHVRPIAGKSAEQEQSDILFCKDQATLAVNTAGRQTQDFLLGFTIVGAPIAYERDKAAERRVFADCMQAKGYTVDPATDDTGSTNYQSSVPRTTTAGTVPEPPSVLLTAATVKLDLPGGFEDKPITDEQKRTGIVGMWTNRAADVGVALFAERRAGVTDVSALAMSRRGSQASRLDDASPSDIATIAVGRHKAYRWETRGQLKGLRLVYVVTIIDGSEELITISTWTSAANFELQSNLMHGLADRISGID